MSYKGGDLDLRTPLGLTSPAAATGAAPAASAGGKLPPSALARTDRSASIWVDETVMACCNLAFELASAHRADLVRTEHLLHALVLVERTTDALQRLGVDADALRRETGALIAADLPALPNTDSTPPGRSNEFEQILQVAGQRAYALRRPISAADLIASLLEGPANGPGVKILQRHRRDVASLASSSRRERVRVQAVSQHTGQQDTGQPARAGAARSGGRTPESAATAPAESEANRPPGADSASTQERANADPNALPPKGAVVVLEPTAASRGQGPYEVVVRTENLRAVEALENKFSNIEQALSSVLERITGFERDLRGKLDEDSSRFDAIAAHLTAFEAALTEPDDAKSNDALVPHLTAIAVQNGEMSGAIDVVRSRLTVIETATEAQNAGNERLQAVMASLSVSLAAERKAIVRAVTEPVERRLAAVEASLQEQHIEGRDGLREIGGRLARTEDSIATLGQQVTEASERFQQRHVEGIRAVSHIGERLAQTEAALSNVVQQIVKATERLQVQRQSSDSTSLAQIGDRLAQTEVSLTKMSEHTLTQAETGLNRLGRQMLESSARYERDIDQVQNDLVKININQQTIAANMDQWRENTLADLGTVGDRLHTLERSTFRTAQIVEALALSVQDLHEIAAKAEERRTRFSRWLFGPDDFNAPIWKPLRRIEGETGDKAPEETDSLLPPWLNNPFNRLKNTLRPK